MPSSVLSSDSMHIGLLAAAAHAAATNSRFTIFYNPRASPSEFVIPLAKYAKAVYHTRVSVGMRFRMLFETEESSVRREKENSVIFWVLDQGKEFDVYDEQGSMIMAWLWYSMMPKINETCMLLITAKDIWDVVHQTYLKALDATQVNLEKDRVYDFLVGLNVEFDQVRVQILSKELPTLNETISIFQAEESKRSVMLEPHNMEGSTMVANKGSD
ncbi:Auxin response factor 25 [Vitis vinifera]|uniref:Auxin response factor 25 n=1 Tax=Vitis vinifera TaxID=29760 RepID=A0A438HCW3_VITVI|nr:Auxin response factor 25 [Vitis vinifera]